MAFDILKPNAALNAPRVPAGGLSVGHEAADGDFVAKLSDSVDRMRQQSERQDRATTSLPVIDAPLVPNVLQPNKAKDSTPDTNQAITPSVTCVPSWQPEYSNASLFHSRLRPASGSVPEAFVETLNDEGSQPLAPTIDSVVVSIDAAALDKDKGKGKGKDGNKDGVAVDMRPGDRSDDPASAMLALLADHRFSQTTPNAHVAPPPIPSRISAAATRSTSDTSLAASDMQNAPPANSEAWLVPLNFFQEIAAPPHGGKPLFQDMAGDSNPGTSSPGAAIPLSTSTIPATPLVPETPSLASSTVLSMSTPRDFATSTTNFATRALQDGTTQAVLRVSPDALGPVEARVQLIRQPDGSSLLSMTLTMSNAQALDTARQSVDDLRHALSAAGLPPVNLTLRLEAPVAPAQSNGSSQSALHSGQQFAGSGGNGRQQNGRDTPNDGWRGSGDQPVATAWTSTRLFDKSA